MASLALLAREQCVPSSWKSLCVMAYVEGISCVDALLPLHLMLATGYEWKRHQPITVICGDVFAAFDNLE
eukprot:4794032-Karenia_brevis.AAC.1